MGWMDLPRPFVAARLLRRYQRFLVDVELDTGDVVTAHCPNPGRMAGLATPGLRVWLWHKPEGRSKLRYGLLLIEADGTLVGIDTGRPNALACEALTAHRIPELAGYPLLRREVAYGQERSRIDLLLQDPRCGCCWVEIKNVHWRVGDYARFPDAVTARGAKHLRELKERVAIGERAVMLYVVQRSDCTVFGLADRTDPAYARACRDAATAGVEMLCYRCHVTLDGITLERRLPVDLETPEP